ncbi:S8 family serine peptidase [Catellatospora sichuanensis]|uniref:S8 family serine peptidase n=1 Tax=Catellatospora sichuanensis TaxID=1969805 RepID=UPI00118224B8|nr:S8 family serine peptidase [Catellatospora sichuanensis]
MTSKRRLRLSLAVTAVVVSTQIVAAPAAAADEKFLPAAKGGIKDAYVVVLAGPEPTGEPSSDQKTAAEVDEAVKRLLAEYPGKLESAYHRTVRGFAVTMQAQVAQALSKEPEVAYVEQQVHMWFTGEQTVESWGLGSLDQRDGFDRFYRWDTDGTGVHAYVVDTGIRATHSEFEGRASGDVSFVPAPDVSGTGDCQGHGTAMAGVIGGKTHGVAKGARLHTVRIGPCVGDAPSGRFITAMEWIAANAARPAVVNLSTQSWSNLAVDASTHGLINRGITVVGTAGNGRRNACDFSPSRLAGVITVGGLSPFRNVWDDPEGGQGSSVGVCVDLFAPAEGINSAHHSSDTADGQASGTSYSTAFVTGAVARYLQRFPQASPAVVQSMLLNEATRDKITDPQGSPNLILYLDRAGPGNDGYGDRGADVNGDGRHDIVSFERGASADVYVALSTGSGFGPRTRWHEYFSAGNEIPLLGDVNGDGRDDLITFTRGTSADVYVALSTGSAFGPAQQLWHTWFAAGNETPAVGDFNGDGRADIATFTRGSTADVYVATSDGTRFVGTAVKWSDDFAAGDAVPMVGDFDCNRVDDVVSFQRGTAGAVSVATSSGNSFRSAVTWLRGFATGTHVPAVGDFNGDGCDDVVEFYRGTWPQVQVALSATVPFPYNSRTFAAPTTWHTDFAAGVDVPGVGDFTGEGRDDIIAFGRGYGADVHVAPATTSNRFWSSSRWHESFAIGGEVPMPASMW